MDFHGRNNNVGVKCFENVKGIQTIKIEGLKYKQKIHSTTDIWNIRKTITAVN